MVCVQVERDNVVLRIMGDQRVERVAHGFLGSVLPSTTGDNESNNPLSPVM